MIIIINLLLFNYFMILLIYFVSSVLVDWVEAICSTATLVWDRQVDWDRHRLEGDSTWGWVASAVWEEAQLGG